MAEAYHPVRADFVIEYISEGYVPEEFCSTEDPNVPNKAGTINLWAQQNPAFAARLADAKRTGALALLTQCKRIADSPDMRADQKKIMIDVRMKLAAIWNPNECREVSKTETVTTVRSLTPMQEYVDQCVSLLGMTAEAAEAEYKRRGGTVQ